MLSPHQIFCIKRNILLYRAGAKHILAGQKVGAAFALAASEQGQSKYLARAVYFDKDYPLGPFKIYDEVTGEVIGNRTPAEIMAKAKELEKEQEKEGKEVI